jgi:MFS family permease
MSYQPPAQERPRARKGASLFYRPPGPVRRLFHRWVFGTDKRYAMFQTIVGTTIANVIAVGILAGIAAAVGVIHLSFSWSWSGYWFAVVLCVVGGIVLLALFLSLDLRGVQLDESGKTKKQALFSDLILVGLIVIFLPLLLNLIFSLHFATPIIKWSPAVPVTSTPP